MLVLPTYAVALLVGEALHDVRFAGKSSNSVDQNTDPDLPKSAKWNLFSGLLILLKHCIRLGSYALR
jgi:hypothetical protein